MLFTHRVKRGVLLIMGSIILFVIIGLSLSPTQPTNAYDPSRPDLIPPTAFLSEQTREPVFGVFEGITPCSGVNRPLPQIPENTNCEQMIWKVTLYQDPATGNPTTYKLSSAYGLSQQNTTGLQGGGTALNLEGKWTKGQGTKANPNAVVYQLNPDTPQEAVLFVKLDDNLLHVLTQDRSLMIGNAGWSYTLNRTDKRIVPAAADGAAQITPQPVTSGTSGVGVFEGRIPCTESVKSLFNISAPGCLRVKLRLILHQNEQTHAPTTYELLSVHVGTGNTQYRVTGTWAVLRGTKTTPDATVYQISLSGSQQPISFLKADDNHLFLLDTDFNLMVGDALMSHTLSKAR